MSSTSLSFWTPIQHYSIFPESDSPPVKLAAYYCQDMIEAYFSYLPYEDKVAVPTSVGNREVVLIDPPSRNIICEIFLKIIIGLSYLTVIIPAIMLIAKCILRCGVTYQIQQEQPAQNTQDEEADLEMQPNNTVPPAQGDGYATETPHDESTQNVDEGTLDTRRDTFENESDVEEDALETEHDGTAETNSDVDEESLDGSENSDEEEISSTDLNPQQTVAAEINSLRQYYLQTDRSEITRLENWFNDTQNSQLKQKIEYLFGYSKITPAVAWNMLLECTAMDLNNDERKNHPLFRTIYVSSTRFLMGVDTPGPIKGLIEANSHLITTPPHSFLISHHRLLTSYDWSHNRRSLPGLLSYFPIPLQEGYGTNQIIWEMDEDQKFFYCVDNADSWFFFQESNVSYMYDYPKDAYFNQKLYNTFGRKLQFVSNGSLNENIKRIYQLCITTKNSYKPHLEVYAIPPT
jgi:hypothetical protein